jgi:hypothetical protein
MLSSARSTHSFLDGTSNQDLNSVVALNRWLLSKRVHFWCAIIAVAAFRLWKLGRFDIWYDEAISIFEVAKWPFTFYEHMLVHPPGFSIFLRLWLWIFHSPFGIRLLPFLFGMGSIVVAYRIASRLYDHSAGIFAILILGFSPFHVYYGREIRDYMMFDFLYILAWNQLLTLIDRPVRRHFIILACIWIALFYTHYYAGFAFIAQFLCILFLKIPAQIKKKVIIALICGSATFLAWVSRMLYITDQLMNHAHLFHEPITWRTPLSMWRFLSAGYEPPVWIANILAILLFSLVCFELFRGRYRERILLFASVFLPMLICLGIGAALSYNYLLARYLCFMTAPIAVFAAAGIRRLPRFSGSVLLLALLAFQLSSLYFQYRNDFRGDFMGQGVRAREEMYQSSKFVRENWRDGDVIAHACLNSVMPYYYYLQFLHKSDPGQVADIEGEYMNFLEAAFSMTVFVEDYGIVKPVDINKILEGKKRLWLIASQWDFGVDTFNTRFTLKLHKYLDSKYPVLQRKDFFAIPVILYDLQAKTPGKSPTAN